MTGPDVCKEPELFGRYYQEVLNKTGWEPTWRSHKLVKLPNDILLYGMAIWKNRPDFIIEIGTHSGGSALMLADFCEMNGKGHVITIDPKPRVIPVHPRVTFLQGSSTDPGIFGEVRRRVAGFGSCMISVDGDHSKEQVYQELLVYPSLVTKDQYLVLEDCYMKAGERNGPSYARDWFLENTEEFELTNYDDRFLVAFTRHGWLRKK